jgi:hypothetical protein
MKFSRRNFLVTSAAGFTVALRPAALFARAAGFPRENPLASLQIAWTSKLPWDRVQDVSAIPGEGEFWDERLERAQDIVSAQGGGVIFFPPGVYRFKESIRLRNGVILRGAEPEGTVSAHDEPFSPPSRIEFPRYVPLFSGEGTAVSTAFEGIVLANPSETAHCGVVHLSINRGHILFGEGDNRRCGANRLVFGCVLRNAAGVMAEIPSAKENHPGWLRYTHKFRSAIRVHASENALVANNRIPKSGDDNFIMEGYPLKDRSGAIVPFDLEFDYDNRPGIYVNQHCIGGSGGSADSGTPETHPWGFRKGSVIRDNYIYNTGRCAIGFSGDGVECARNVIRFARDAFRPTVTGVHCSYGSSTNDNRAIEMRGWRWVVEENDYEVYKNFCSDRRYYINDGEGLMHENHCNSSIVDSRLINNRGNSYLSLYHVGAIDGLHIEGNDISTPGRISDIYVTAPRHKAQGDFPIRRVTILKNITRSNGIRVMGWPGERVVIRENRHAGTTLGMILNEAGAEVTQNTNYEVKAVARS